MTRFSWTQGAWFPSSSYLPPSRLLCWARSIFPPPLRLKGIYISTLDLEGVYRWKTSHARLGGNGLMRCVCIMRMKGPKRLFLDWNEIRIPKRVNQGHDSHSLARQWPRVVSLYAISLASGKPTTRQSPSFTLYRCTYQRKMRLGGNSILFNSNSMLHVQILLKTIRGWATASVKDDDVDV